MADRGKTKIVNSFVTLKAVQRRVQDRRVAPLSSPSTPTKAATPPKKPGTHIGRTVMPTRYEIVCYSCEFVFMITGKANRTHCPKCREMLDLTDHTITGIYSNELVTAGRVTIRRDAVLDGGRITANGVTLEGTVQAGHLHVRHTLELAPGAVIPEEMINARNLCIAQGASVHLKRKAPFKNVDVHGELRANLWADGMVTIHPGGHLQGTLHTAHFSVLEGGGLTADVWVEPKEKMSVSPPKSDAERGSE